MDTVIEALATNSSIQVLYFQGYGIGMKDDQLKRLSEVEV